MSEAKRKSASAKGGMDGKADKPASKRGGAPRKNQGDVGRVLRSVYDTTLNEDIPDDFLDLLGKLD